LEAHSQATVAIMNMIFMFGPPPMTETRGLIAHRYKGMAPTFPHDSSTVSRLIVTGHYLISHFEWYGDFRVLHDNLDIINAIPSISREETVHKNRDSAEAFESTCLHKCHYSRADNRLAR
jgi:hypothetical protein